MKQSFTESKQNKIDWIIKVFLEVPLINRSFIYSW